MMKFNLPNVQSKRTFKIKLKDWPGLMAAPYSQIDFDACGNGIGWLRTKDGWHAEVELKLSRREFVDYMWPVHV